MANWKEPFLTLKQNLRPIWDSNLRLHHAVLLSTNCREEELRPLFDWLEPAIQGKHLARSIPVSTEGCTYHGHLFFAEDRRGLDRLGRCLAGVERWCEQIPPGVVPSFEIPPDRNQTNRDLMRWASLVYYLAWTSEAPYLEVELEHQESASCLGFLPWLECPQPPGCLPLKWLIHQGLASGRIEKWKEKFEARGERIPDIIDAYMWDDFIAGSLAAIDILIYVLYGERREKPVDKEDYAEHLQRKVPKTHKVKREIRALQMFLAGYHNPSRPVCDDDPDDLMNPLTAEQIAEAR